MQLKRERCDAESEQGADADIVVVMKKVINARQTDPGREPDGEQTNDGLNAGTSTTRMEAQREREHERISDAAPSRATRSQPRLALHALRCTTATTIGVRSRASQPRRVVPCVVLSF